MSYKWVTMPVTSNPAGAFAKALFIPVAKIYVNWVVGKANKIASHKESVQYSTGGPVYHEYC